MQLYPGSEREMHFNPGRRKETALPSGGERENAVTSGEREGNTVTSGEREGNAFQSWEKKGECSYIRGKKGNAVTSSSHSQTGSNTRGRPTVCDERLNPTTTTSLGYPLMPPSRPITYNLISSHIIPWMINRFWQKT